MRDDTGLIDVIDGEVLTLALAGLCAMPKTLPAKLFYDEAGCRLFQRITELPEYYVTRTEHALLADVAPLLPIQPDTALIEYGASDEEKATYLLGGEQPRVAAYIPIDVARPALESLRHRLRASHPDLAVYPICADFEHPLTLPGAIAGMPRLGLFPGSTVGNLNPDAARRFFTLTARTLGAGAQFLVGADLRKSPDLLIPAYDDAAGVTAQFNRNVLTRLNHACGADFNEDAFAHRAVWNDAESRIEMHLVSRHDQTVHLGDHRIRFHKDETIHTENSYKYTPDHFTALAAPAGWQLRESWTDRAGLFALYLLSLK